jgi:uncharacterized protein (DUF736 family)
MSKQNGWLAVCAAAWLAALALPGRAEVPTDDLRHAVACPPFKGPSELAQLYHGELVALLKETETVEYLEGPRALSRRAPEYSFRVAGKIVEGEDGERYVSVTLTDAARKEAIATHLAPASTQAAEIAAWRKTLKENIRRRSSRLPFECRVRFQRGQNSLTLDRGLGSGLRPGMLLDVALAEELLISPRTGEVVGRDVARPIGQVKVFRVMETSAYARPVGDAKLPRSRRLVAKTF